MERWQKDFQHASKERDGDGIDDDIDSISEFPLINDESKLDSLDLRFRPI
jgi:hypothetical protein